MTLSPRMSAHLGLGAASVVLMLCFLLLGMRAVHPSPFGRPVIGQLAPEFSLRDLSGKSMSLSSLRGKVVVAFFASAQSAASNDYVSRVIELAGHYAGNTRVQFLMIDSDAVTPRKIEELSTAGHLMGQTFPTLLDNEARTARSYHVTVAPTFCIIDGSGILRYRGAFDDQRDPQLVNHHYCADALKQILSGEAMAISNTEAIGTPLPLLARRG